MSVAAINTTGSEKPDRGGGLGQVRDAKGVVHTALVVNDVPVGPSGYALASNPAPSTPIKPTIEARFWAKVDKRGPDECWPWTGSSDQHGYGQIWLDGKMPRATHISLSLDGKPRPGDADALHSCDNPPCVNPSHLRWGTALDNVADARNRGRIARGESNGQCKITETDVVAIRNASGLHREIALAFGVSAHLVSLIRRRKRWAHVA